MQTNGPYGGQIWALAAEGPVLFASGNDGPVYVSNNYGESWRSTDSIDARAFLVKGSNVFAAGGLYSSSVSILRSTDSGVTWIESDAGIPPDVLITSLAVCDSLFFAGTENDGIFRSTDNGLSWNEADSGLLFNSKVLSLAFLGKTLYAGLDEGLYFSTDFGTHWSGSNLQLGGAGYVESLLPVGTTLLAGTLQGIFISTDSGSNWMQSKNDSALTNRHIYTIISDGNALLAGTSGSGIFRSTDTGRDWSQSCDGIQLTSMVNALLASKNELFVGTDGGIFRSTDNGITWIQSDSGINTSIVTVFGVRGDSLFAGTEGGGLFVSTNNGYSWSPRDTGLTDCVVTAFGALGPDLFAGTNSRGMFRSTNNGESWKAVNNGLPSGGSILKISNIGSYILINTNLNNALINQVFRSNDTGMSWHPVKDSSLVSLAFLVSDSIVFGATGFNVYRSTDSGFSWKLTGTGIPDSVNGVDALSQVGTTLFAGTGYAGIYRSTNGGENWEFDGLPNTEIYTFAINDSNLFAGGYSLGGHSPCMFLSTDKGDTWSSVGDGFAPYASIYSLAVEKSNLFAADYSQGVWRRPLSEMVNSSSVSEIRQQNAEIQDYPNPFSTTSTIRFTTAEPGPAQITIENILGISVAQLYNGELGAGEHSFSWNAENMPDGVYFAVIREGNSVQRVTLSLSR